MSNWKIILAHLIFLTGCQPWWKQPIAPAAQPMAPYPMTAAPQPVFVPGQPYAQPGPILVSPGPGMVPVYPEQMMVEPAPGCDAPQPMVAVPMHGYEAIPQPMVAAPFASPQFGWPPGAVETPGAGTPRFAPDAVAVPGMVMPQVAPNPISVPVADEELAWDQIVDVVSDYFTVAREHRARRSGEIVTEGRIETAPQDGATWLEPYRRDSVGSFNRWESTFQTIRRRATIRVIPDSSGYLVEAIVEKELEDLPNPEKATAGAATFREEDSLPSRRLEEVSRTHSSPRWIQLGRDPALEQRMLADIQSRLGGVVVRRPIVGE